MIKRLLLATAVLFTFTGMATAGKYSKTEVRTFDITPDGSIKVENVNGSIVVETWDKNQVSLEITKTVRADDQEEADEYFADLRIEIESGKDYVEVSTHYPHGMGGGFFNWLFHGGSKYVGVEYSLKVPSGSRVDVGSTNGKVEVHGVTGEVKAHSTNGGLNLTDVGGKVEASTTNGGIHVSISRSGKFGDMDVHTTNGGIKVYLPADINADVDAHTTNGGINSEFPITVSGSFSSRSLSGKINNGGNRLYLHTTNGGIDIIKQ